jgi:hypothetical protein
MQNIRKFIFSALVLMVLSVSIFADKNILVSDLPNSVVDFMKTYFSESKIDNAEYDDRKYEIWFSTENDSQIVNGEAEFSKKGDWEKIEFYLGIPETLLPENVLSTLRQNFSDKAIVSVERNKRGYELTLVDATEVDISEEGKILEIDSEHPHKKFDKDKSDRAMKFKESKNDNSSKLDSVNTQ